MDWPVFAASVAYGLIHSLLAAGKVKEYFGRFGQGGAYRIVFNVVAIAALVALLWLMYARAGVALFTSGTLLKGLGGILLTAGIVVGWQAFRYYDAGEFLGLWSAGAPAGLQKSGPNAWVRHPLYSATLLLLAGIVLLLPQRAVCSAALGLVCYLPAGIYWEEQKLLQQFGTAYADYQKRVKRVIPGIW